jgi:1,5-anhydro-D-fructose reductase (1,5-anhydro-D-mannitol-forming)
MIEAFRQRELPLFVAYYRRHLPKFEAVRRILEEGKVRFGSAEHAVT